MPLTGKELVRRYEQQGWMHVRTRGSHFIMQKDNLSVSIPIHGNKTLQKGIEAYLLKFLKNKS